MRDIVGVGTTAGYEIFADRLLRSPSLSPPVRVKGVDIFDGMRHHTSMNQTFPSGITARVVGTGESARTQLICDDCRQFVFSDSSNRVIRHGKRCDNPVQPDPVPARWTTTAKGRRVVVGPVADVRVGQVRVGDELVDVASVGSEFTIGGVPCRYGYPAEPRAVEVRPTARECGECGAVEGVSCAWVAASGMECSRCR